MATNNVNFKIKNGLVVEGTTGTINGADILTKNTDSDNYIIDLIGGETLITSVNSVDFEVTNGELSIGSLSDLARTGDLPETTKDITEDQDYLYFTDARAKTSAAELLTGNTTTLNNITITGNGSGLTITAENGVADSTTDDLTEGTNNLYYSNTLVDNHLSGGDGISYQAGTISADVENGLVISPLSGKIIVDRTTTDTWYDAEGAAGDVATDLSTHETATTGIHGVTGDVVGTSDTQTLSNKMINGNLDFENLFVPGSSAASVTYNGMFNALQLTSTTDVRMDATNNVIINAPDGAYIGSASAENEIATHSYVDNAVSGLSWKQAVNLLAHTSIALTGDATSTSIDGHSLASANGYRVLLTGQTTDSEKGIYDLDVTSGTYTLTRAADSDTYQELIGAAVYVMEGTTYGSTSWVQGDHYLTDFTSQEWTQFSGQGSVTAGDGIVVDGLEVSVDFTVVAEVQDLTDGLALKQDTLTAGSNIDITGSTISVTGLTTGVVSEDIATNLYFTNQRALDATASAYDASGAAATAETNANSYTDTALGSYTTTANLENTVAGYGFAYDADIPTSTDGLSEGINNLYFTDARAKTSAINLLTSASTENITIAENLVGGLTITAENGVADSTTDDLTEGETNLYFQDSRAVDAVDGADITPATVTIDTFRKEEATHQYVTTASTVSVHSLSGMYESVKYLVRVVGNVTGTRHSQLTEILLTTDGNGNIALTEYGTIYTSESPLATFSATMALGSVPTLTATTLVGNTEIIAAATMLSWAD